MPAPSLRTKPSRLASKGRLAPWGSSFRSESARMAANALIPMGVSAASLYVVVGLRSEGVSVDQVEVQKINEAFPEPEKVGDLARALAHALATSPRLRDFLDPK